MTEYGGITSDDIISDIAYRFNVVLKPEQLEVLETLFIEKKDAILTAKTGYGKSITFHAGPLIFYPPRIALIIMPLKALEDQQCDKLAMIDGCKPFVLNGESNNDENLRSIVAGHFTHVMTSPEIVMSKRFNLNVLRKPEFSSRLCLLAIDELHLVHEWRDFRPEYYNLAVLRSRLPDRIPFLGVSATLDSTILATVLDRCGFGQQTKIIRTSLDRPEIFIQTSTLQYSAQSMLDLQFLLPSVVENARSVPKTVIFMDTIADIHQALKLFRKWMKQLHYPPSCSNWVCPFFSDIAEYDKKRVSQGFEKPSPLCEAPRILIATDAYGLGIDNPDIKRVVQWLHPASLARLFQRLGRAVRSGQGDGSFVLLFQSWCIGARGEEIDQDDEELESSQKPIKGRNAEERDAVRRQKLPFGIWEFINPPTDSCYRKVGLRYFNDPSVDTLGYSKPLKCCSRCHPDQQLSTEIRIALSNGDERDGAKRPWYLQKLQALRLQKAHELFPGTYLMAFPSLLIPDSLIDQMISNSEGLTDEKKLSDCLGSSWKQIERIAADILKIFQYGQRTPVDQGELFTVWSHEQDIKRKRIPRPIINQAADEFEERRDRWIQEYFPNHRPKKEPKKPKVKKSATKDRDSLNTQGTKRRRKAVSASQAIVIETPAVLEELDEPSQLQIEPPETLDQDNKVEIDLDRRKARRATREPLADKEINIPTPLPPSRSRPERRIPARFL